MLVTGGTGLIGGRLVAALARDGVDVRVLTRSPEAAGASLPTGARAVGWDGTDPPADALAGAAAAVHLAGEPLFAGPLVGSRRRRVVDSRVESTRALVRRLSELPEGERPGTLVSGSAVGFYGDRGEQELTEDAPAGTGFLADLCRSWEASALPAQELGVRVVTLRTGVALAREGGALPRMALPFRFGLGGRLGSGRQWLPWIHVEDLVDLIRACLGDERYAGPVNGVSPEPVRNEEFTRALAGVLRRPALLRVPAFALRTALGDLAGELLGSRRVLPARAAERGFAFREPEVAGALARELG